MTQTTEKKWLILPLEIVERELHGKLLIAQQAINNGWGCIVGPERDLYKKINSLPPGAVMFKSLQKHQTADIKNLQKLGHKVFCLDEEGLIQNSLKQMVDTRTTPNTMDLASVYLCWGEVQAEAFKNGHPDFKDKIHVSGNPRVDIWSKPKFQNLIDEDVKKIKQRFGDFLFFPTTYGVYNHVIGKNGELDIYVTNNEVDPEFHEYLKKYTEYVRHLFYAMIDLVKILAVRHPETHIVIRPHPSEAREPWNEIANEYNNVHVVFEGSVTPWLKACATMIHCGSTTAIEAHLLGKPVLSYCPQDNNAEYALEIPEKIAINIREQEKVLNLVDRILKNENVLKGHPEVAEGHEWLKGWIANIDSFDSADKIMEILETLDLPKTAYAMKALPTAPSIEIGTIKTILWKILSPLEYIPIIKDNLPFRIKYGLRTKRYIKNKTGVLKEQEITDFLNSVEHENPVTITPLNKKIFALN